MNHTDGLVQDCSNSIANALELLQFCTKPSTCEMGTKSNPSSSHDHDSMSWPPTSLTPNFYEGIVLETGHKK